MATDGNLSEVPLPMQPPPERFGSAEGRQQQNKRRAGHLTPPPPLKIRYVDPKEPTPPSPDLPAEEKPPSDLCAASYGPLQPKEVPEPSWDTDHVMAWRHYRLPKPVYVRVDCSGAYHSYPELSGPFQSFDALESALHTYACRSSTDTSKETEKERLIRESLEWSDGTKVVTTTSELAQTVTNNVQRLVKALLDKKNDDEDFEYERVDIVHWQSICEGPLAWYYHLNIIVKTKGADDDAGSANLFFAEVTRDQSDTPGYFLSSFCRIDPNSKDGVLCHGCMNNGSTDMKHPPPTTHFDGGHVDTDLALGFGPCNDKQCRDLQNKAQEEEDEEEELRKEEEQRIRESFDYLDDVEFEEKLRKRRAKLLAIHSQIQEDEEMACKD